MQAGEGHRKLAYLPNNCREIALSQIFQISAGKLSSTVMGMIEGLVQPIHRGLPESVSGFQDSVASSFKKLRDLLHLIGVDTPFIQCFAEVPEKPIEMPVV